MTQPNHAACRSPWGSVTIAEDGRHTWTPSAAIANDVYADFEIAMDCSTGRDGFRRFTPSCNLEVFILRASVSGLAILAKSHDLGAEERQTYRFMSLLNQRAPMIREHLSRSFKRVTDLLIRGVERAGRDRMDVLPDDIGRDPTGRSKRWTVSELVKRGRAQAVNAGDRNPNEAQCIAAGLLEAAKINALDPKSLTELQGRGLVRGALFAAGPAYELDAATRRRVEDRLIAAFNAHLDKNTEDFNDWWFENGDNLIHQIAKQKKGGGKIDRAAVRQVLLDLVFEAYRYTADCFCYQMQAFVQALPRSLDERERAWFEALYFNQTYLGGLPLVFLRDRFDFLKGAGLDVIAAPEDPGPVAVLLRLLHYYEEMITKRRDADRDRARQRKPRDLKKGAQKREPLELPSERQEALGQIVITRLRENRRVSCSCPDGGSWSGYKTAEAGDLWSIVLTCDACGCTRQIEAEKEELKQILQDGIASTSLG